jgi:hypothetical protein
VAALLSIGSTGAGTVLALDLAASLFVLLVAAVGRGGRRLLGGGIGQRLGRSSPAGDLPPDAGETLESEAALGPLPAGLARPVEGAESGVDSALVCLGAELVVGARRITGVGIDGPILTMWTC